MPLPGIFFDGSPLLQSWVLAGADKIPFLGTKHSQGPQPYKGATLAPVFWQATINSPPVSQDPQVLCEVSGAYLSDPDARWPLKTDSGWLMYRPEPHDPPYTDEYPAHPGGVSATYTGLSNMGIILMLTSFSRTMTGNPTADNITNERCQVVAVGNAVWGLELSTPWPDVMVLDGLTLPYILTPKNVSGDWTGSTLSLAREAKPRYPYPGRPSEHNG